MAGVLSAISEIMSMMTEKKKTILANVDNNRGDDVERCLIDYYNTY
jgi:hypothetical protein